jgi:heat shock protein HslJ
MRTLVGLVLFLAACGAAQAPTSSAPAAVDPTGSWQLVMGTIDGGDFPLVDGHPITLTVEGSEVTGSAPCNGYGGRFEVDAGRLRIGELGMTAMACEDDVMVAESAFVAALERVDGIRSDQDALMLIGPGVELRFAPLPEPPTAALVDTAWVLDTLFVGDVASAPMGDQATLELRSDGTINGSTGCRGFDGTWVEAGEQIMVTSMAMTDNACPPDLQQQDDQVVSVIGDGFVPSIEGDLLTLTDPGGLGLVYRRAG